MRTMGIDIGTTTICATVIDGVTGEVRKVVTLPNDCFLTDGAPFEKKQDAAAIVAKTSALAATMIEKYPPIGGIGVTGQMHGIVYLNAAGTAVSPLTIWQDGRGDEEYRDGQSYAAYLSALTGYKLATG
ncbi:MAG: FGGY family carbohydrate kinase, partial [Oscillospiraceae bacterium]|nr:FGGY family carbohydrate kinase [Oscillospiraceae bacterium]